MKKVLIAIVFILSSILANAQRKGLWLSGTENLGFAALDNYMYLNLGLGVGATYMFTDKIGIKSGIEFQNLQVMKYPAAYEIPLLFKMVTGRRFGFFMEPGIGFGYYGNRPFSKVKSTLPKETFYATFRLNFGFHIPIKQSAFIEVGPYLYLHDPSDIATAGIKLDVGFNVFRPMKRK